MPEMCQVCEKLDVIINKRAIMALDRLPESFPPPPQKKKKKKKIYFFVLFVPTCDLRDGASFDPRCIIRKKVHYQMLLAKYQSCRPPSFRDEEF